MIPLDRSSCTDRPSWPAQQELPEPILPPEMTETSEEEERWGEAWAKPWRDLEILGFMVISWIFSGELMGFYGDLMEVYGDLMDFFLMN